MKTPFRILVLSLIAAGAAAFWHYARAPDDGRVLRFYGNVDIRQIALAFDGSGRVETLHAEEGDRVKAGKVLARLDTRTLSLQAQQAEAQIAVQEHNLARLCNGARPQELEQARNQLVAAQAEAERAAQDFTRAQQMFDTSAGGAISVQAVDAARSTAQVTRARAQQQQAALRLMEEGARSEDIAAAKAQLQAARATLALLEHQISLGELIAPADAVVRSRLLEVGDMATPQRPVFALALTDPKWVRVYVGESDLGRIRSGMAAQIITDSAPVERIFGTVGYISSVAEFTPKSVQTEELRTALVYEVRVLVDDPHDRLRLGQPVTVHVGLSDY